MKTGFITTKPEVLAYKFPTAAEPDFVSPDPLFTPDDYIAVNYFRNALGFCVEPVLWGTPVEPLKAFDSLVVRSPWDYTEHGATFFKWLDKLAGSGISVFNKPDFMTWLLDKHYLQDFSDAGIAIVPTDFYEPEDIVDLKSIFKTRGPFVIKPAISAAARGLYFIDSPAAAESCQLQLDAGMPRSRMVQDFVSSIQTHGEWSLVYFGGQYSHAVHKKPKAGGILVQAEQGGSLRFADPDDAMIAFGNRVIQAMPKAFALQDGKTSVQEILYVRLDILETPDGYQLSECEGVEPELFFRARPGSEKRFADALLSLQTNMAA